MTRVTGFVLAMGLLWLACGGSQDTNEPLPPLPDPSLNDEDPRAVPQDPNAQRDHGTVHAENEQASGGSVVSPDGAEVDLSTTYAETNALIVFYRGHW